MTKTEFANSFSQAAQDCLAFTRTLVFDPLPDSLRFNILSGVVEELANGMVKFMGGRVLAPEQLLGLEGRKAGAYLWVDGQIPVWVNLSVSDYDSQFTYIDIRFNPRRLTREKSQLMYQGWGNPPFHILGPAGADEKNKILLKTG